VVISLDELSKLPQNQNLHVTCKFVSVIVSKVLLKVFGRIFGKRVFKYIKHLQNEKNH